MKSIAALLLLFSFASGLRPFSGLPATGLRDQNWLKDEEFEYDITTDSGRSNLVRAANSWVSGHFSDHLVHESYEDSLDDDSANAIGVLVGALHSVIPALTSLKEQRDALTKAYADEFAEKLMNHASDLELKRTLGRHVLLLYARCHYFQLGFLHIANQSGLFQALNEAVDRPEFDSLDLMIDVLNAADHHDFGMFDRIEDTINQKGLHNNPALMAFGMMSRLFTKAACGDNRDVDGLLARIGDIVHSKEPDIEWEIEALASPFAAQKDACGSLLEALHSPLAPPKNSLKLRLLTIIFEPCKDVEIVHYVKETALKGLSFFKSMYFIQQAVRKANIDLSKKVEFLLENGKEDEADALVGYRVLHDMRIGILIGLAIGKELEHAPKPSPKSSAKKDTLVRRQKMHYPLLRPLKVAPTQYRKVEDKLRNSYKQVQH